MRGGRRRTALVAAVAIGVAFGGVAAPTGASATDCTENYYLCLNDAVQESDFFARQLKEIECGIEFTGCLAKKLKLE